MSDLNSDQKVIRMARELGVDWRSAPAENVVAYCVDRIKGWLSEFPPGTFPTMEKIERLVCAKLKLVVEHVENDAKLDSLIAKYAITKGEGAFAHLREDLDAKTYGVLMRRENAGSTDRDHFVAFVDCRGDKKQRGYFSRWHEIAHMLTMYDQLALPFHRSKGDASPTERLMDMIAGEIGFFDPIFRPALEESLAGEKRISFKTVEALQAGFAPTASFQATLIACLNRSSLPTVCVEAGLGLKIAEQKLISSGQLLLSGAGRPVEKLRVLATSSNPAARARKLAFHPNMEVPEESAVYRRFYGYDLGDSTWREKLSAWRHSDGRSLGSFDIELETRRMRDRLFALVSPAS